MRRYKRIVLAMALAAAPLGAGGQAPEPQGGAGIGSPPAQEQGGAIARPSAQEEGGSVEPGPQEVVDPAAQGEDAGTAQPVLQEDAAASEPGAQQEISGKPQPGAQALDGPRQTGAREDGGIPQLRFVRAADWVKVEVIDNVTNGCFLKADEAREHAESEVAALGLETAGDEEVFHVIFRIRATGQRTPDGDCFGAIFFEELYPIDVAVTPNAEPYRSRWPGRLGLQKLVITNQAFDREVIAVIEDGVRILFRERR